MEPVRDSGAVTPLSGSSVSQRSHAGREFAVQTSSNEAILREISTVTREIRELNAVLETKKGILGKGLQAVKNIAKIPASTTVEKMDTVFDSEILKLDKKDLKQRIKTKEAALQALEEKRAINAKIVGIFNDPSLKMDLFSAVKDVYDENSRVDPKKPNVELSGVSLSQQTHRDLNNIHFEVNGTVTSVKELVEKVGTKNAQKILCLTNQQLAISLMPYFDLRRPEISNRQPGIHKALKAFGYAPYLTNEPLKFKIDVKPGGEISLTIAVKIQVQHRETNETSSVINAKLTIDNVTNFPDKSLCRLEYSVRAK